MTEKELNLLDLEVGDTLPPLVKDAVSRIQLVRYAGASGDFNPLHTVNAIGEKAGFGGVIAHGMLIMGFTAQAIANWVPNRCLRRFGVRFVGPTRPGDIITVTGRVTAKKIADGENIVTCEVAVTGQNGDMKLSGSFDAVWPVERA